MTTVNDGQQFATPKKVREDTFYTLLGPEERITAERMADGLGEKFIGSHFEKKWFSEYYFHANNEAFLEHLAEFDDAPEKIYKVLSNQLDEYVERTPIIPRWGHEVDLANLYDKWLNHTRFICRNAYSKTKNEVYAEAVRWVENYIERRETHAKWVQERKAETQQRKAQEQAEATTGGNQDKTPLIVLQPDFEALFGSEDDARTCLRLMHYLTLTKSDGSHNIGTRGKANLLAFVEALQQKRLLTIARPLAQITSTVASQIDLTYPRPRKDNGKDSWKYEETVSNYLSNVNQFSTEVLTWPIMADKLVDNGF